MGFFSDLVGGSSTTVYPDPYGLGMQNYRIYQKGRKTQFKLFARQYKADREALSKEIDQLTTRPVVPSYVLDEFRTQSDKQSKRFELGAANRGFFSSTVPGSMAGHAESKAYKGLLSHYGDKRQARLDQLRMTHAAMPGQYYRGKAALYSSMPQGLGNLLRKRALMGSAPYSVHGQGMFGGAGSALMSGAGTALGVGLAGLI